jgi:hypothetical protein
MASIILLLALIVPIWSSVASAEDMPVGTIKTIKGAVYLERQGRSFTPSEGDKIFQKDLLKTGRDGAIGVTFKDNTVLSLGSNTKVVIKEFLFSPAEGKLSIVTRLVKGTVAYLTGMIAKISPEAVRFETPVGNAGIRGTKFVVIVEGNDSDS